MSTNGSRDSVNRQTSSSEATSSSQDNNNMREDNLQLEEDDWWDADDHSSNAEQNSQDDGTTSAPTESQQQQPTQSNSSSTQNQQNNNKPAYDEAKLRQAIREIQSNDKIDRKEKARLMQYLMSHGTLPSSTDTPTDGKDEASAARKPTPEEEGYVKSFYDEKKGILGCKHYQRNVKLQANCCQRIFSCRFCHDEASDHNIIRHETKNMLCMLCMTLQPAAKTCNNCGVDAAWYYCDKCKLWDNDKNKSIYHCDDCGICRQGRGLGQDFFHCKKCNICMTISMKDKHRCIERNLESDCPICGEYMFTSTSTVIFMPCGHCIHRLCYTAYIQTSYQCPTCLKSLGDMREYFARLDRELERQPMPPEYAKYISHIFCNDCEKKSTAKYHFFYHKCVHCGSYNTTVLRTENTEEQSGQQQSSSSSSSQAVENDGSPSTSISSPMTSIRASAESLLSSGSPSGNSDYGVMSRSPGNGASSSSGQGSRARGLSSYPSTSSSSSAPPPPPPSSSSSSHN